MASLAGFEILGSRVFYRPSGSATAERLADLITDAMERAHAALVQDVVVNITGMTGFESPGAAYRRWAARRWARALGPRIRLAMVARHEHICPKKTGLLVAAEEGVEAHVCEIEAEAVAWLNTAAARRTTRRRAADPQRGEDTR